MSGRRPDDPAQARGAIALLAAGSSSRMAGRDKLLETIRGVPLLRLLAGRAISAGWPLLVTLPPDAPARRDALAGLACRPLDVPDAGAGMAASFRRLAGAASGPLLIMLADMPEIQAGDIRRLLDAHRQEPGRPIRAATAAGRPGQPVLFPARLVPRMAGLTGDEGARRLLEGEDVRLVPLPGECALTDLDTPDAWAEWRARTGLGP